MFKRTIIFHIIGCCALFSFSSHSNAWGQEGHRVVCNLAFEQLQNTTKRQVKKLVAELSSAQRNNLNQYQGRSKNAKIGFGESCVWADAIRDMPQYKRFSAWHYVNVSRDYSAIDSAYCINGCVLEAIPMHYRVLAQAKNDWDKAQALMFLAHWVADIHQPLHVGFEDDKGGNLLPITVSGQKGNFHSLWDSKIIDWVMQFNGWDEKALAKNIDQVNIMGYSIDYSANAAAIWAEESRQLALHPQTGYCRKSGKSCVRPKGRAPYVLSPNYMAEQWPQVKVRLKLASMRLAALLEDGLAVSR